MRRYLLCIVLFAALAAPGPVAGQQPWRVGIEATAGVSRGHSDNDGRYRGDRKGMQTELLLGAALHPAEQAGAFVAISGTHHAVNIMTTADCPPAPDGGCVPWFPGFGVVSLLGGWESRTTNLRLLAGPGVASSDRERVLGISGRVDAAMPVARHLSFVGSLSALVVPSWRDDRFSYIALGAGLRLR